MRKSCLGRSRQTPKGLDNTPALCEFKVGGLPMKNYLGKPDLVSKTTQKKFSNKNLKLKAIDLKMKIKQRHPWPQTKSEAIAIQEQLQKETIAYDVLRPVQYVAGVDVGYDADNISRAAVAVLSFPSLQLVEQAIATRPTTFPYIPGLLSFREVPAILDALEKLSITPDILLCDGQGLAHPRRFGLACHLGVIANLPSIGVAKSLFIGEHDEVAPERGSWQPLIHKGETVGAVLRSRAGVNPIYVSIGHRISLSSAIDYVLRCAPKYRLPETTRIADHLASASLSTQQLAVSN